MAEHGDDLIEILVRDHRELGAMSAALPAAGDPAERRRLLDELATEFAWYAAVEETCLHPAVRRVLPDGDLIADRAIADAAEIERRLDELQRSAEAASRFAVLSRRLVKELNEQMSEKENALYPRLARHVGPEERRRLGAQVESAVGDAAARLDFPAPVWAREPGRGTAGSGEADGSAASPERPAERPPTPQDPDANAQASMWPDVWADHRHQ
jgi:hypothetical protein